MHDSITAVALGVIALLTAYTALRVSRPGRAASTKSQKIFVDTSVLIDGRIVDVAKHGFLPGTLVVPRSVLGELQFMADNADTEKRQRARHGLDVVRTLQELPQVHVQILADESKPGTDVDARLRELTRKYNGILCTIDYNLIKVAEAETLRILNVNELALALRMSYLPGERTRVELTTKGNDNKQAVGHLPDGTMVVVEDSFREIGKAIEVEFIRSIQTSAGRMMFAKPVAAPVAPRRATGPNSKTASDTAPQTKPSQRRASSSRTSKPAQPQRQASEQPATPASPQPRGRRRRETNEDALIRLVNDQQ